jgi:elongation factor P
MASTSDIKNGLCIKFNGDLWQIVQFQHVKPGKGAAFVRTKIKNLTSGKVLDNTFPAGSKIEPVRVENRTYQYLYNDETGYHFMNMDDYNQIFLQKELINAPEFLKEGFMVDILFNAEDEAPLTCDLPAAVELQITYTEPGVKGDTATNSTKAATLETGAEIQVPLFIDQGEVIKVSTADGKYMERAK